MLCGKSRKNDQNAWNVTTMKTTMMDSTRFQLTYTQREKEKVREQASRETWRDRAIDGVDGRMIDHWAD